VPVLSGMTTSSRIRSGARRRILRLRRRRVLHRPSLGYRASPAAPSSNMAFTRLSSTTRIDCFRALPASRPFLHKNSMAEKLSVLSRKYSSLHFSSFAVILQARKRRNMRPIDYFPATFAVSPATAPRSCWRRTCGALNCCCNRRLPQLTEDRPETAYCQASQTPRDGTLLTRFRPKTGALPWSSFPHPHKPAPPPENPGG